ncbi:hypothetical protein GCM10009738_13980 [Kitasatospora viridis]|uniref:Polyketide cyclase/dehydrase/lipid transport protein n=2 Tax=Kitasatospora viridis TaxID=281105 RepID=A0A561TVD6_9ACTN|nr:hypothetical protein FHX73_12180 [Kitasatospora viridis]
MIALTDTVDAPVDRVLDLIADRYGPAVGLDPSRVEVDREHGRIAYQGGWWYRGEYEVTEEAGHTRVTHRVLNVAGRGSRWAVPLANKFFIGFRDRTTAGFRELLREAGGSR